MANVVFGSVPYDPECDRILENFDSSFKEFIVKFGLHSISVLDPTHGLVVLLRDMGITSEYFLVYSTGGIAQCVGSGNPPPASEVQSLFAMNVNSFTWKATVAAELAQHQSRVQGRFMSVLHKSLEVCKECDVDKVADEDAPIQPSKRSSCDAKFKNVYGEEYTGEELPCSKILGIQYRSIESRNVVYIPLSSVVSQNEDKEFDESQNKFLDVSSMQVKERPRKKRVNDPASFLHRLRILLNGFAYVGIAFPAPAADWSGDDAVGVVRGVRYQFSKQGASVYYAYWNQTVQENKLLPVNDLVRLEKTMRMAWHQPFRDRKSLVCSAISSISEYRGSVVAAREAAKGLLEMKSQFSSPNFQRKGRNDGDDTETKRMRLESLPGFDSGISTGKKTAKNEFICKPFNDNRSGKGCTFGDRCKFKHVCDVLV